MSRTYRVIVQTIDTDKVTCESTIMEEALTSPINCIDFTMGLDRQMNLIRSVQDYILNEKLVILSDEAKRDCPECPGRLVKIGKQCSTFHDTFSEHQVVFQRLKCRSCGYEAPCTARTTFGGIQSGDLQRIQAELGSKHSFREAEDIFSIFTGDQRGINNHDRIKKTTESLGTSLLEINNEEQKTVLFEEAQELILNIDGGHVKTTEDQRSIEAITSVVYRPESILSNSTGTRNELISKNCAASVKNDQQEEIIAGTIIAALKQGISPATHLTSLCDGAANCWKVSEALRPFCKSVTSILDWFHIAMKMENISLPEDLKTKFLRVKWYLWRGNTSAAVTRIKELMKQDMEEVSLGRLASFLAYIENNAEKIVNYKDRQQAGLVFTSNLAESTVESLINQRCKGKKHMRWSREGLNPVLQLRAAIHSQDEWQSKWKMAVLNAA